ncbi:MAG: bifunctional DNA primase/polymerase [Candidatus Nitrosocosmicus sp.]|nr:bifunctional DNA primase/polymerase [Candidatus Nitrosocosmicus sp.]
MVNNFEKSDIAEYIHYWYYEIGVNVIPADTKDKSTNIEWSNYKNSLTEDQLNEWITKDSFRNGLAIIMGKIHRGRYKGKYLCCIDIDNEKGINEFLSRFGSLDTLEKLAEKTIIEMHMDNKNKCHIYFVVDKPLSKKSGIKSSIGNNITVPAIEVKSLSDHGIMFCTPSPHKNGHFYEIIGTKTPSILNEENSQILENVLNDIYNQFDKNFRNDKPLTPIEDLFDEDFVIYEGNNRHEELLRAMESLISRLSSILPEDEIKQIAESWNQKHCKPPLDNREFERQWHDAKTYISKKRLSGKDQDGEKAKANGNSNIELIETIRERYIEIFKDQFNSLYVTIKINNHIECIPLDSSKFKSIIRAEYYNSNKDILSNDQLGGIIDLIQSQMMFDENISMRELNLRVAKVDNTIIYDLTNPKWEIVKISSEGWDLIQNSSSPLFKRFDNTSAPQVYPSRDYSLNIFEEFLDLFNLGSKNDRLLLSVYVTALLIPSIPKPILIFNGQGGGAKTTAFNIIKRVIDPGSTDTISFPTQINELIQTLDHNYISFFDNVSKIKDEVSDLLCRAVTGTGFVKRVLYTNDSDMIYKFKRCIGVNGINLATTRPDFLDRSLIIKVKRIEDNKRKKEEEIYKNLDKIKPELLGFMFDIISKVLRHKIDVPDKSILKDGHPRMADFAEWGERISRCLRNEENKFITAYYENINNQNDEVIESSVIAESIVIFVRNRERDYQWKGTPTRLLKELNDMIDQIKPDLRKSREWPKTSSTLTPLINEVIPNLRLKGIEVITGEKDQSGDRMIIITKLVSNKSESNLSKWSHEDDSAVNFVKNNEIENLTDFNPNIHRVGASDIWICDLCSSSGDIHFMNAHDCKGDKNTA